MGKLIEGLWDCAYCGSKQIRGSIRDCPNCGRPRNKSTKFYLPNDIQYVEPEKANSISQNPDWLCQYCNSLNSDSDNICKSCGSDRTTHNLDYFSMKKDNQVNTNQNQGKEANTKKTNDLRNYFKKNRKFFLISILILSFVIGMVYVFIPKTENLTINSFYWERSIEIEKYQAVNESDWNLPQNARLQYTNEELYGYEDVFDHYETRSKQVARERFVGYEEYVTGYRDLGNGYFEEITNRRPVYETYYETEYYNEPIYNSVPVYRTKYYYEIDKWLYDRSLKTSGQNQLPYWHELPELQNNEKISTKKESYYIIGTNTKGKRKKVPLDYETWKDLNIGEKIDVKVSIFNKLE